MLLIKAKAKASFIKRYVMYKRKNFGIGMDNITNEEVATIIKSLISDLKQHYKQRSENLLNQANLASKAGEDEKVTAKCNIKRAKQRNTY